VGGGSGFIISESGMILTNKHVVEDPEADYTVVLSDGREYKATIISRDTLNDIAVAQLMSDDEIANLPTVKLGSSTDLKVGQQVVAIGNALAEYQNSVTTGIISAKGRDIVAGTLSRPESLINLLQTDTAINPGNSGGPLVNLNGEVIGVNTAVASGAEGIGFAIPIDDIVAIIESVKLHGRIVRPFLGVRYVLLDEAAAKELQIDVEGGALLTGNEEKGEFSVIPGSPAEEAGLKTGDVILEVDGKEVTVDAPLQNLIAKKSPGDEVELKVWRSGEVITLKATLVEAK
jgi:serine protease Do